jgi:hypothetical protein
MKKTFLSRKQLHYAAINLFFTAGLFFASCGGPSTEPASSPEAEGDTTPTPAIAAAISENMYKPFTWLSDSDWVHPSGAKLDRSLGVHVDIPSSDIAAHNFVRGTGDTLYLELITTEAVSTYSAANSKVVGPGTSSLLLTANDLLSKDAEKLLNKKGDLPVLVFLIDNESTDPAAVRIGRKLKGKGWVTRNF